MPRKRMSKRPHRRRFRRKIKRRIAKRRGKPSTSVMRGPSAFPDRMRLKLKYTERVAQTHTAGISSEYVFSGNSIFDPNVTGSGHQPYGFDQWANFYSYYTVYGSKIKVNYILTTNSYLGMDMAIVPSVTQPISAQLTSPVEEMPYCKYKIYTPYNVGRAMQSYMSTAKIYGVSKIAVDAEDNYGAAVTNNPANRWYWSIITQPSDEATANTNSLLVTITYYCEFLTRKNLSQS